MNRCAICRGGLNFSVRTESMVSFFAHYAKSILSTPKLTKAILATLQVRRSGSDVVSNAEYCLSSRFMKLCGSFRLSLSIFESVEHITGQTAERMP
jgi:hypothetical protein